VKRCCS